MPRPWDARRRRTVRRAGNRLAGARETACRSPSDPAGLPSMLPPRAHVGVTAVGAKRATGCQQDAARPSRKRPFLRRLESEPPRGISPDVALLRKRLAISVSPVARSADFCDTPPRRRRAVARTRGHCTSAPQVPRQEQTAEEPRRGTDREGEHEGIDPRQRGVERGEERPEQDGAQRALPPRDGGGTPARPPRPGLPKTSRRHPTRPGYRASPSPVSHFCCGSRPPVQQHRIDMDSEPGERRRTVTEQRHHGQGRGETRAPEVTPRHT